MDYLYERLKKTKNCFDRHKDTRSIKELYNAFKATLDYLGGKQVRQQGVGFAANGEYGDFLIQAKVYKNQRSISFVQLQKPATIYNIIHSDTNDYKVSMRPVHLNR
ncbi:MAG: hypothetical protein KC535_01175 [Nanoarchaeota archaeon]|nr:hypothetical protein [Nanoarchaeota archaeon]